MLNSRGHAPGQNECEGAINKINNAIKELDRAALAAVSQSLPQRNDNTLQVSDELEKCSSPSILEPLKRMAL